jgi:RNA polymerase sigma-70 factor (ECF subfamily)
MVASLATVGAPAFTLPWALPEARWHLTAQRFSEGDTGGTAALTRGIDNGAAPTEPFAHVLKDAQNGDRDAFVTLMSHYDRRLRSLAYRLLDDKEAMVDTMQDVYVKAFRGLPQFQGRSAVGTWLYRITYTTCLDHRQRRRPATAPYDDATPMRLDPDDDPSDTVPVRIDLAAALKALSDEHRAAVLMVDRDGYAYHDAAEVLGIPMGTLASRLSAARAALRRALSDEEVQP